MSLSETWYIVKQANGQCTIASASEVEAQPNEQSDQERWGPFESQQTAIARRVGLIRAGKCNPA